MWQGTNPLPWSLAAPKSARFDACAMNFGQIFQNTQLLFVGAGHVAVVDRELELTEDARCLNRIPEPASGESGTVAVGIHHLGNPSYPMWLDGGADPLACQHYVRDYADCQANIQYCDLSPAAGSIVCDADECRK